jgi:hypothetical protein
MHEETSLKDMYVLSVHGMTGCIFAWYPVMVEIQVGDASTKLVETINNRTVKNERILRRAKCGVSRMYLQSESMEIVEYCIARMVLYGQTRSPSTSTTGVRKL